MEEEFSHSENIFFLSECDIRSVEKKMLIQIEKFEKTIPDGTYLYTFSVCDAVKSEILDHEDEVLLSKTYNNYRKIVIASELFIGICSLYNHIVDNEFSKIVTVNDMFQRESLEKLSKKITRCLKLQQKRQKYFAKEAQNMLKIPEGWGNHIPPVDGGKETSGDKGVENQEQAPKLVENREELIALQPVEVTESVAEPAEKPAEILSGLELPPTVQELVEAFKANLSHETFGSRISLRPKPTDDSFHLDISKQDVTLPVTLAGVSLEETRPQSGIEDDINEILKVLENENPVGGIEKPEHSEIGGKITEAPTDASSTERKSDAFKESEEWTLPMLEPIETEKKQRHLKIDKATYIHDYATKALQLNRNIQIERVQVFEGPPKILQAMSVNHLMKTPGYKRFHFRDVRSSKLNSLYERHLQTDEKPVESVILPQRTMVQPKADISKARRNVDIVEKLGVPSGMRSGIEKTDVLTEIELPPEKILENLETSTFVRHPKDDVMGVTLSRIVDETVEPPEAVNAAPILPLSRVHELQGKDLEPRATPTWFFSKEENPPSEKYRKFNYVFSKLQEFWFLFESQGMEKCITLREFFTFLGDDNVSNFLTVLRIVDKMSIQRKLVLEYKNPDVFIRPFETPYVSERQVALKGKEPVF